MRAIWFVVSSCVVALVLAGCGTSLGPQNEGLELQPSPPAPPREEPAEPDPLPEPLPDELDPELDPEFDPEAELEVEPPPVNPFAESVRLLFRGRSARVAVTATGTLDGGEQFTIRTDGTFDVRAHVGSTEVDATNLARQLGATGTTALAFVPTQMQFTEKTVYLNYERLPSVVVGEPAWAAAAYRQFSTRTEWPDQGAVAALALTSPTHIAAIVSAARNTLVAVGEEPIRGASSTHYLATAELAKVPAAAPEVVRGAFRGQMRALAAELGTSELPIEVWLDGKGRLRRVQIDLGAAGVVPEAAAPNETEGTAGAESPAQPEASPGGAPAEEALEPAETTPAGETTPADGASGSEPVGGERTLEGQNEPSPPGPPSAVVVVDFITFSGRARVALPSEDETTGYPRIARLARATHASLTG